MEWEYIDNVPLVPVEIINPFNNKKSRHRGLIDSGSDWCSMPEEMWAELEFTEIGLMDLGTPMGWMEAGFSWL